MLFTNANLGGWGWREVFSSMQPVTIKVKTQKMIYTGSLKKHTRLQLFNFFSTSTSFTSTKEIFQLYSES